ncbi:MAG: hypothetical protein ABJE66_25285 [Deltaproteobacteria bacterium]
MTNLARIAAFVLLVVAACRREPSKLDFAPTSVTPPPETPATPGAATATTPGTATSPDSGGISGTVVETMPASTYTYARLDHDGHEIWVAGPETPLAVGAKIGPLQGTLMTSFHSDTLNRTFPEIYFVSSFGQAVPPSHAPASVASAAPAESAGAIGGTVVATMDSGGYTYAQLDRAGVKTWVAGPPAKLAVGAKVTNLSGTLMTAFHSSTLDRTFDQIYFIGAWGTGAAPAAHAGTPGTGAPAAGAPAAGAPAAGAPMETIAPAPHGKTVAEIFAGRAALEGKAVDVRGKVVKVTNGVLDRNWVHLRDGTGAAGANDLMITTKQDVKVGEVVTAHGTIGTNRDLGAGYHYDVLVESATLTR